MRLTDTPSLPVLTTLDPIIMDDVMEQSYRDADIDFLDSSKLPMSTEDGGENFDELFGRIATSRTIANAESACLSPSRLSLKKPCSEADGLTRPHFIEPDSLDDSQDNSSPSSSSESPRDPLCNQSIALTSSEPPNDYPMISNGFSEDWMTSAFSSMKHGPSFRFHSTFPATNGMDTDIESSNRAMDAAFDFESAASSPSPLDKEIFLHGKKKSTKVHVRAVSHSARQPTCTMSGANLVPERHDSREVSPLSELQQSAQRKSASACGGQSPSSVLEDFREITMNSGSPMNTALSPSVTGGSDFSFSQKFSLSHTLAGAKSEGNRRHILTVHPTALKSRVETQIPIKLTFYPLPSGIKKLRLPTHTISKPKFLAPSDMGHSPDTLELHTSLVCTSAMQGEEKLRKAFARARGESVDRRSSSHSRAAQDSQESDTPLNGSEVKICTGCILRERKRASRKKQRKPEEDEFFQKDEKKRAIVFNTNQLKDWVEPPRKDSQTFGDFAVAGVMQVDLPMRITCYCRHHNEKLGFQVIFTIKDYKDNVVAQAITNSIMITDDHKTHPSGASTSTGLPSTLPDGKKVSGVRVYSPSSEEMQTPAFPHSFRVSHSTTDLQSLEQRLNPKYPLTPGYFAITPGSTAGASNSRSSRSLSRQASPPEFQGPSSKRRKQSTSARLPSELTMTKLEPPQQSGLLSASSMNHGAIMPSIERPFVTAGAMTGSFRSGSPTPNSVDNSPFFSHSVQPQSFDGLVQQQLISAPSSANPSRPGTPGGSALNGFQDQALNLPMNPASSASLWPPLSGNANRLPSVIHKLVPAEGSITGGTEVTLLGSGFYPGMEVVFGDTLATTTTFWGDKCLNCLTPPALQPGLVAVVFKHEHPTFGQIQPSQPILPKQQQFFRYVDDRELQMYRIALGILGQKLGNQADAFQTARQIMGADPNTIFTLQNDFQGASGGHQRQVPGQDNQGKLSELDAKMLTYLEYVDLDDNPRPPRYNSRSATGLTLLHFAASLGLTRFVAGLLARGSSPDLQDNNGHTPMHLAALNGHAHIVHRLRLAGANGDTPSVRGFTPADLATTLAAHQAALMPCARYRSRSVGSLTAGRRRHGSTTSLNSFWEISSASDSFGYNVDESESEDEYEETHEEIEVNLPGPNFYFSPSRRSSIHQDGAPSRPYSLSRQNSTPPAQPVAEQTPVPDDARGFTTPAALVAWRNQLAAQINQFQQSFANAFPNLPALPPLPALPDYQAHQMMRRITNLVPHRPTNPWSAKEGWWELLTGNSVTPSPSQPPSYEELYPHQEDDAKASVAKKVSLLQATTEAAVDLHFESQASSSEVAATKEEIKDIKIGRESISREQQTRLREQHARRMKGLGKDRNLFFVWIPLLLLVVFAWIRSYVPGIWQGFSDGLALVKIRYMQRAQVMPA